MPPREGVIKPSSLQGASGFAVFMHLSSFLIHSQEYMYIEKWSFLDWKRGMEDHPLALKIQRRRGHET